ncbi:D-amino-acid transaminase [Bacillus sp. FJAT-49736]|uniref:D-amino-acid transaminase n=1 Tax=Bacillus sp. FJAT-49736 TaxID=2833582 RepID=UPI001BCA1CF0|nr:D-amino-acid transaminase [Bacillus sp. FJAT-49736]MBS4173868.1 D-amino-acid transaminase [Bacillus sp. FJAT-49736]
MAKIIFNGEIVDRTTAAIDIEDRGYQFGDGIYEVIRVYNGKLFTKNEHIQRLYESAEKIGLKIKDDKDAFGSKLEELVKVNSLDTGIIYLQFTRGVYPRQHGFPEKEVEPVFVAYTKEMKRAENLMKSGVNGLLVEDIRWLRCDIKSLNLLGNILAKQKAAEADCYEAIQHRGDKITEGSSSNVFMVKDGILKTHPVTNLILNGITRQVILKICKENEFPVKEVEFSVSELTEADEVFISSTTSEIMPIVGLNSIAIGNGKPGEITKKLQQIFEDEIQKQCEKALSH